MGRRAICAVLALALLLPAAGSGRVGAVSQRAAARRFGDAQVALRDPQALPALMDDLPIQRLWVVGQTVFTLYDGAALSPLLPAGAAVPEVESTPYAVYIGYDLGGLEVLLTYGWDGALQEKLIYDGATDTLYQFSAGECTVWEDFRFG